MIYHAFLPIDALGNAALPANLESTLTRPPTIGRFAASGVVHRVRLWFK
jgi:hypothetical protein